MNFSSVKRQALTLLVLVMGTALVLAQSWKTIEVKSEKMGRTIPCTIVLPDDYFDEEEASEQYPVVYVLHGHGGNHKSWVEKNPDMATLAAQYGFIIVCPDGQNSWYWDSPIDPKMQFETHIISELVPYIDANYRTIPERNSRAITGLSMGGHGALWLAMRHPDVFCACGSMSGGVDIRPFPKSWNMADRLGPYEGNEARWNEYTVINLVPKLKPGSLKIIVDCGVADFFYPVNVNLHDALLAQGIDHDFYARPGKHTWSYWVNALDYHMLFFAKAFLEFSEKEMK